MSEQHLALCIQHNHPDSPRMAAGQAHDCICPELRAAVEGKLALLAKVVEALHAEAHDDPGRVECPACDAWRAFENNP